MEHLCSTPASVHEKLGYELGPSHLYIIGILSPFVSPSFCLFVEKRTPVGFDFDQLGEHPLVENLDDAS